PIYCTVNIFKYFGTVAHIANCRHYFRTCLQYLFFSMFGILPVIITNNHICTVSGEIQCNLFSDIFSGSGYHHCFSFKHFESPSTSFFSDCLPPLPPPLNQAAPCYSLHDSGSRKKPYARPTWD